MTSYSFEIPGSAAPQGSKRYVGHSKKGHAVLVEQSTKVKPWRAAVVAWVYIHHYEPPLEGPLGIDVTFYFERPVTGHNLYPARTVGDLDKLLRSTFDAFTTSRVWQDDSQVVQVESEKLYTPFGAPPFAAIRVWQMIEGFHTSGKPV